jgi:ribosomal protein L14
VIPSITSSTIAAESTQTPVSPYQTKGNGSATQPNIVLARKTSFKQKSERGRRVAATIPRLWDVAKETKCFNRRARSNASFEQFADVLAAPRRNNHPTMSMQGPFDKELRERSFASAASLL